MARRQLGLFPRWGFYIVEYGGDAARNAAQDHFLLNLPAGPDLDTCHALTGLVDASGRQHSAVAQEHPYEVRARDRGGGRGGPTPGPWAPDLSTAQRADCRTARGAGRVVNGPAPRGLITASPTG